MQATLFMSLGLKPYSQWFKGSIKEVADTLSCHDDRSDEELTNIIKSLCPLQVPSHIEIQQLPNKITSWLTALLLKLPMSKQLSKAHTRRKLWHGVAGQSTWYPLGSKTMTSLKTSLKSKDTLSGKQGLQKHLMIHWLWEQSEVPCSMYLQSSEKTDTPAQPSTRTDSLHGFYKKNFGRSKILTQPKGTKQLSFSPSSQKSTSKTAQSLNKQPPSLLPSPSSLQCILVSTSRYTNSNNKEQKSSESATSVSSGEVNNLITTTSN
jgi:hypothetical protein